MASPFFFVGKKDGSLRPCQDYQYLNEGTVTNKYQKEREKDPSDKQHNFFDDGSCIGRMIFVGCLMLGAVDGVEWER